MMIVPVPGFRPPAADCTRGYGYVAPAGLIIMMIVPVPGFRPPPADCTRGYGYVAPCYVAESQVRCQQDEPIF
jgi:hypothetical protein